jgi:hypothetical protein
LPLIVQELQTGLVNPVLVYRVKNYLDELKTGLLQKANKF